MARKSVDVDQELDDNTAHGEFESERGGFRGSNRRSAPGMKAFVILMALLALVFIGITVMSKIRAPAKAETDTDGGKAQQANTLPNYSFNSDPEANKPATTQTSATDARSVQAAAQADSDAGNSNTSARTSNWLCSVAWVASLPRLMRRQQVISQECRPRTMIQVKVAQHLLKI